MVRSKWCKDFASNMLQSHLFDITPPRRPRSYVMMSWQLSGKTVERTRVTSPKGAKTRIFSIFFNPQNSFATIENNKMKLKCDIFNHDGNKIYSNTLFDMYSQTSEIGKKMGEDILSNLGQKQIDNLDFLKNDFDYTPS